MAAKKNQQGFAGVLCSSQPFTKEKKRFYLFYDGTVLLTVTHRNNQEQQGGGLSYFRFTIKGRQWRSSLVATWGGL